MNEEKKRRLFAAARRERAVEPPSNFADLVMNEVRRDTRIETASALLDVLSNLFPRFAAAALLVIALSFGAQIYFNNAADYVEVAEQWFFAPE